MGRWSWISTGKGGRRLFERLALVGVVDVLGGEWEQRRVGRVQAGLWVEEGRRQALDQGSVAVQSKPGGVSVGGLRLCRGPSCLPGPFQVSAGGGCLWARGILVGRGHPEGAERRKHVVKQAEMNDLPGFVEMAMKADCVVVGR